MFTVFNRPGQLQIFMNANSAEDWQIAITWRRLMQIAFEIAACAPCPIPVDVNFRWTSIEPDGEAVCLIFLQ